MGLHKREVFLDTSGRPITQSLFLEIGYSEQALYTLKDYDHEYNGKILPSIKNRYIEMADPTEYEFANMYFLNWAHWQRICENKVIRRHIDEWRNELEVKLRSRAVKLTIDQAEKGSYQAAKWLADRGWATKGAGRPTRADIDRERKIEAGILDEYGGDVIRLKAV